MTRETAEEAEARLAKKLKEDKPPELKKGHQKQFEIRSQGEVDGGGDGATEAGRQLQWRRQERLLRKA